MANLIQVLDDGSEFQTHILQMLEEYGDEEFCLSLIEVFIRDGALALGRLRNSVESRDAVKAHATAHSLKNMLGVLHSQKGIELAEQVCAQLTTGFAEPPIHELFDFTTRLLDYCQTLVEASRTV